MSAFVAPLALRVIVAAGLVVSSTPMLSVSAYTDSDGMAPWGITASGAQTRPGICACGPSYPFGTWFRVGNEWYVCLDRGGAITDDHLDIWMLTDRAARRFGRKELLVWALQGL